MKRFISLVALLSILAATALLLSSQNTPTFDIGRPTILAFFPPVTQTELVKDPDTNESLSDFQFYASQVQEPLEKAGVNFKEVYAHSFRIRVGKTVTTFRPVRVEVGYYFVAPGKEPRIEYGVMSDVGLLQIANEYFGVQKRR